MLKSKYAPNPRIKQSRTRASNQFKIVVIGLPNIGSTHLIHRLLNIQFTQQTKRFKIYHCTIDTTTFEWRETDRSYQPPANDYTCIRVVIFEIIATKTILDLLYLLIAPEDIILLVYDPLLLNNASYMADIDYILNFVSAHCNTECCSSAVQSRHFPVVLMTGICTIYGSYSQAINFRDYYHGKTCEKHILQQDMHPFHFMFPEHEIRFLNETILTAAEPVYSQHCPSMYLQFEQAILELYGRRSFITTVKASVIADEIGIQATEKVFEHFRNKGIILYYPKVQGLQDKIFISPRLIIAITIIFEPCDDNLSLQESFMQFPPRLRGWLVYLLENFDLAVAGHWSFSITSKAGFYHDGTPYIIPSLIHAKEVSKKLKPEDYVGILYCFPDEFLPRCLFYQLMTKLIDWFHANENSINSIKIGKENFRLESKDLCELRVQFNSSKLIKCYIKIPPTERAIKENLYPNLLDFIQEAVTEICNFCLPSAQKPVYYLECPFDHGDNRELPHLPFNEINNESNVICKIMNIPIPRKFYECLFGSNSTDGKLDDSKDAYALALKEGKARPFSVRILIVGPENSGKTCLVESLLGGDFKCYSNATQGADISVCKFFTTNWLRVQDELMPEKLQKDFCSKLKATVMEQSKAPIHSDEMASSSSVHEGSLEHCIPSITITPAIGEIQNSLDRRLSLPIEELPVVSMEDLMEAELSSPVCENEINTVIWDVSGQTIYHGLLPAFLSEDNVAIITFDASRDLYSWTKAREDSDSFTKSSVNRKMTACQVVCYWCKAIYSICRKKGTHSTLSRYLPTIFLVGTHIDKLGDNLAIEKAKGEIIGLLVQEFIGKPFARLLAGNCGSNGIEDALKKYCFFVSNLKRNPDVFCKLKEAIIASCQHIFNERHPVMYLKIEKQLLSLNKSSITTAHFHEIAQECGFMDKFESKKFSCALQYFHSKGIIMYFPFIESLNNLIVLSPQWLAKLLAFVIVAHPFKQFGSPLDKQYDCLIKEGVLYKEFFNHMVNEFNKWSTAHNRGIKIEPEQAMDFVKSFYIVAEIDKNAIFLNNVKNYVKSAVKDKLYLVPSMLPEQIQEINSDDVFQNVLKEKFSFADNPLTRIIHYQFPDGFVPTMTFLQVIAACIERNTSKEEELSWLSRHHCKMVLADDQYYYVSLCEQQDSICLIMTPDERGIISETGLEERRELVKFFNVILVNIVKSLSKKSEEIQLPIAHVPCPQCYNLHFTLEVVCATKKRALRCKTKIPLDYYSDLAEKANMHTSHNLPDQKKLKPSPKPDSSSLIKANNTGGGTPTVPLLMEHLDDVTQWKEFGMHLLPTETANTEIEIIDKGHSNDVRECKRQLYTVYLQQGPRTWERVVEALEKSRHFCIAQKIKETFL